MSEPGVESGTDVTGAAGQTDDLTDQETQDAEGQLGAIMDSEDPDELKADRDRWKGLAQRHERTARDNKTAADKWREQEKSNMTELQRAQADLETAQRERDAAMFANARMTAAATHNLDPDLIDFLGDGTPEEITSRAETLARVITESATRLAESRAGSGNGGENPRGQTRRPVQSMRPGAAPAGTGPGTPDQMFRQLINGDSL